MGINQRGSYLMKNLKESANLIKGHNGWLETVQPYGLLIKRTVETEYTIKAHMFCTKCRY